MNRGNCRNFLLIYKCLSSSGGEVVNAKSVGSLIGSDMRPPSSYLLKGNESGQTHKTFQGQTWTANELLRIRNHTIQQQKYHIQTLREVSPLPPTPSIHYKTIIETLQRTLVPQKYFTCRLLKTGAFAVHHHHLLIFSSNRCPAIKLHATALLHVQNLRRQRSHGQGDGSSPPDGEVNVKDK